MSDEETKIENGEGKTKEGTGGKVELEAETYEALLERLAELEDASTSTGTVQNIERSSLDDLADEGTRSTDEGTQQRALPPNLDDMSNTEVAHFIVEEINRQAAERLNKVEVSIETLRVLREIDKTASKYDDFWLYENEVKDSTMANPSMTIEDAYLLAKQKSPKQAPKGEGDNASKRTRTEKLLNLPSRAALGEKPGVAASSTEDMRSGKTIKSAAERAWKETVGEGKTEV
jgi:hypothetical protein